jgi:serine/threonine protein kinase
MQQAFIEKYELHRVLGTGAFSEVRLGTEHRTGKQFAIKIVDRSKCKGKEDMIETEVKILTRIDHPNIVKLYEKFEFDNKLFLVMELVTGGELFDEIVGRGSFPERDAARIVEKILEAILYLHSMGIVHRDLKPENLLLSEHSSHAEIKISDFGLSKIFNEVEVMKTACGTPGYVAPEVLRRQGYGPEVDLWSLGVITYILLCGYPPFFDQKNAELFKKIMAGKYQFDHPWWDNISEAGKDFVRRLLVVDIKKRFTAEEALRHPFIVMNKKPQFVIPKPVATDVTPTVNNSNKGTFEDLSLGTKDKSEEVRGSIDTVNTVRLSSKDRYEAKAMPVILPNIHAQQNHVKETKKTPFSTRVNRLASWLRGTTLTDKKRY